MLQPPPCRTPIHARFLHHRGDLLPRICRRKAAGKIRDDHTFTREYSYVIYRSRKNGSSAAGDLREMNRIPKTGASQVTSSASRASAGSTEYLPGESLFTPLFKAPCCRSPIGAALRVAVFQNRDMSAPSCRVRP
jgi:hypothetical protein